MKKPAESPEARAREILDDMTKFQPLHHWKEADVVRAMLDFAASTARPTELSDEAVERASRYVLDHSRRGNAAINEAQSDADTDKLLTAYRDIITKAWASGALSDKPMNAWDRSQASYFARAPRQKNSPARPTERGAVERHVAGGDDLAGAVPITAGIAIAAANRIAPPATDQAAEVERDDLLEARKLAEELDPSGGVYLSGHYDGGRMMECALRAIKRGRALATQPATGRTMGGGDGEPL